MKHVYLVLSQETFFYFFHLQIKFTYSIVHTKKTQIMRVLLNKETQYIFFLMRTLEAKQRINFMWPNQWCRKVCRSLIYIYIYIFIYIYIYAYINLPVNVIVRLPHPRSGDSHGQEIFLAPHADKQTRNYGTESSNHIHTCCILF